MNNYDEWTDPNPVTVNTEKREAYPLEALPDSILKAAEEAARFAKVPVVSPAVIGLSVIATTIGKKARIEERPGLYLHPALFFALIAGSGEKPEQENSFVVSLPWPWWYSIYLFWYQLHVQESCKKSRYRRFSFS